MKFFGKKKLITFMEKSYRYDCAYMQHRMFCVSGNSENDTMCIFSLHHELWDNFGGIPDVVNYF